MLYWLAIWRQRNTSSTNFIYSWWESEREREGENVAHFSIDFVDLLFTHFQLPALLTPPTRPMKHEWSGRRIYALEKKNDLNFSVTNDGL